MSRERIFDTEIEDKTLIVAPRGKVSTLAGEEVNIELGQLLRQLQEADCKNVVIDLEKASYFGSSMLGALNAMWNRVRSGGGRMAICNVSEVGLEILHVSKFDTLWPICSSRQEAIEKVTE